MSEGKKTSPHGTSPSLNLGRLLIELQRLERYPQVFGEAGPMTPSEIHTIDAIGMTEGMPMSEVASRLNVTKGAVTQIVTRLEAKDLVKRFSHPEDSRITLIALKKLGISAYEAHLKVHQEFYNEFRQEFSESEMEMLDKVILRLSDFFTHYNKQHYV
ncbi:MAG TPA: MarR family transcriptional regulator [Peptococcaceae bacterium]|nr:MarR family transcriptional regulator [Peptococcaceae bacterium]